MVGRATMSFSIDISSHPAEHAPHPFVQSVCHRQAGRILLYVARLMSPQDWPAVRCPQAIPSPSRTICPIVGCPVPPAPRTASALKRPATQPPYIVLLAGHTLVKIRHGHIICSLLGMVGACAYAA